MRGLRRENHSCSTKPQMKLLLLNSQPGNVAYEVNSILMQFKNICNINSVMFVFTTVLSFDFFLLWTTQYMFSKLPSC